MAQEIWLLEPPLELATIYWRSALPSGGLVENALLVVHSRNTHRQSPEIYGSCADLRTL